jgi:lipoate-protein ligase A
MRLLDLTLATPAENIALDEALLLQADAGQSPQEVLRLWESPQPAVVLGRSSKVLDEVNLRECRQRGIEVLRRPSGGAAVVIGPGCLMYAVVLSYQRRPRLRAVDAAHRFVLGAIAESLRCYVPTVTPKGISDLVVDGEPPRKFSGNSLRCRKSHLLYHGTVLYEFPLEEIAACLRAPPREPAYREGRHHQDFVTNLPLDGQDVRAALTRAFRPQSPLAEWPREMTAELTATRYSQHAWNPMR